MRRTSRAGGALAVSRSCTPSCSGAPRRAGDRQKSEGPLRAHVLWRRQVDCGPATAQRFDELDAVL